MFWKGGQGVTSPSLTESQPKMLLALPNSRIWEECSEKVDKGWQPRWRLWRGSRSEKRWGSSASASPCELSASASPCQHRHGCGNRQHRHYSVNCHNLIVIVIFEKSYKVSQEFDPNSNNFRWEREQRSGSFWRRLGRFIWKSLSTISHHYLQLAKSNDQWSPTIHHCHFMCVEYVCNYVIV